MRNSKALSWAMASAAAVLTDSIIKQMLPPAKKEKSCLVCRKRHTHNNAFCSAGCAEEFKGKRK